LKQYFFGEEGIDYCLDTLYWVADRSDQARSEWNEDIFNVLSLIKEDDYE